MVYCSQTGLLRLGGPGSGSGVAMIHIRLLGHYTVQADGRWVELPSRAAQLLLANLVLHAGVAQSREHLAALFWPDSTPDNARGNLRHTLWQLRKALGDDDDCIRADDFTIAFHPDDNCQADVVELERDPNGLKTDEALMAAVAVYDGDLLPGFYEPWVVLERQRLEAVFEQKMELLLDRLLAAKRWTAAIGAAERWIALGATPEPAYRALMMAHANLGHASHLHAAYARCRESLAEGVGLAPSAQTETLYHRLMRERGDGPLAESTVAAPPAGYPHSAAGEAAELRRQLAAARQQAEHERQVTEAHRRAATRATRLTAALALGLAAAVGALWRRRGGN